MHLGDRALSAGPSGPKVSDPRSAPLPFLARGTAALLNDPRDVALVGVMIECAIVMGCGIFLFFTKLPLLYLTPLYWGLQAFWVMDRFTLMLHCTSHRQLFKSEYGYLNKLVPWVIAPFFGQTPNTYFAHHMAMHHREENLEDDLSATLRFRRNRLDHWLRYYLRFLFVGLAELGLYFFKRRQKKQLWRIIVGETIFWSLVIAAAFYNLVAAVVVFVVPVIVMRGMMMAGNWGQHSFVCPKQPEDPYRASITCINTRYNRRCFNDGYHVLHHLQPRCHWTEHPAEFEKDLAEYGRHDAIVFDGLDFFQVFANLMFGRWNTLADHFVKLPGAPERTREQVIELLRERVVPISPSRAVEQLRTAA